MDLDPRQRSLMADILSRRTAIGPPVDRLRAVIRPCLSGEEI
jgi:hypothetical protein